MEGGGVVEYSRAEPVATMRVRAGFRSQPGAHVLAVRSGAVVLLTALEDAAAAAHLLALRLQLAAHGPVAVLRRADEAHGVLARPGAGFGGIEEDGGLLGVNGFTGG